MQYQKIKQGTVLVYTMVLVVLGVFMATVVLNVATELSIEYNNRNIEISLMNIIETKGELSMKYSRKLNTSGSGFIDNLSCPENVSMSGSTVIDGDIDTQLRYLTGSIVCFGSHNNGSDLIFTFNSDFDDLIFAKYQGYQIAINSGSTSGTFGDSDSTFLDLGGTSYLAADGIDDNFDSDNYTTSSTGSIFYPDGYIDNDSDARALNYGYIIENSGLFNVLWSNTRMKNYISENPFNNDAIFQKIGQTSSGYLSLDINDSYRMFLYRMDNSTYNESSELIITQRIVGGAELGGIGYLQNDLSLDSGTGSAYEFDFVSHDYALFIENTSSGALLYQIRGEEATTGSGLYLNPLKDDDISVFSYLGSHMLVDDEGKLIGDQFEVFGLK